jgi:hypothetical protein
VLLGMQTIGAGIIFWNAVPLYQQVLADPAAHVTRDEHLIWALSSIVDPSRLLDFLPSSSIVAAVADTTRGLPSVVSAQPSAAYFDGSDLRGAPIEWGRRKSFIGRLRMRSVIACRSLLSRTVPFAA